MRHPILARGLATDLRASLRQADVDHAAFAQPLALCDLATCRATCCHDGVVLDSEEVTLLGPLIEELAPYGIAGPPTGLFHQQSNGQTKTATRPSESHERAIDFPDHFPQTRCVFLDSEHRCTWQRLAHDRGEAPWTYKPVSCWMHPVALLPGEPPCLTVAGNPETPADFASNTHCGRPCKLGPPARDTLSEELRLLGAIAGRDFLLELSIGRGQSPV